MRTELLTTPAPIDTAPLMLIDRPKPIPKPRELLVHVHACGVCHTDLHVTEGELPHPKLPLIPGHEIVGVVEAVGDQVTRFEIGARVGIPWLHEACGTCEFCRRGQENLCPYALFTGYTADGGYAEYTTVREDFAVPIPDAFGDAEAAPLLCAGIVGYRALRLAGIEPGERVGLYGFGASAHICVQVLRHWGCEVIVFSRSEDHQAHARELGAAWAGDAKTAPPAPLDRAVSFAPAGWIVPLALEHLRPGGTLCINAIHASPIPEMPYDLLWGERVVRTVANATRRDADEFMPLAAQIPIHTDIELFRLDQANEALQRVKAGQVRGAAVLTQMDGAT
ncbi:MAG: zinc-dependent alcohol dehydrogenase family protein [Anaerolineae bacterium]|nr:zinc-dependent alcohol dehydrogenase family protein [Anaerolineae bacterium]